MKKYIIITIAYSLFYGLLSSLTYLLTGLFVFGSTTFFAPFKIYSDRVLPGYSPPINTLGLIFSIMMFFVLFIITVVILSITKSVLKTIFISSAITFLVFLLGVVIAGWRDFPTDTEAIQIYDSCYSSCSEKYLNISVWDEKESPENITDQDFEVCMEECLH